MTASDAAHGGELRQAARAAATGTAPSRWSRRSRTQPGAGDERHPPAFGANSSNPCFPAVVVEYGCAGTGGLALRAAAFCVGALALIGCAPHMIYLRADGVPPASDPVLQQQFEVDRTICDGELQKGAGQTPVRGCMAERGYVLVKEDEVAAKSQELAAIAAEKARREAAAVAPPPPPPPAHVVAKPKPKPKQQPQPQVQQAPPLQPSPNWPPPPPPQPTTNSPNSPPTPQPSAH